MKVMIGLETHVQLNTRSKSFCGCMNPVNLREEPEPNTLVCDTCLGLPGSKPRANKEMIVDAIKISQALNCRIAGETYFSRKTYFYPDMGKNFQITQYEVPLASGGHVLLSGSKRIRIRRVHMEEDPSKIIHVGGLGGKHTLLDYNRAGIPLVEIVTEPDFSSPEEAREFLQKLTTIMEYLGVYDSASRAVLKSDANISLGGGKRVEVKNITGTREIEHALKFEIFRQLNLIKRGGKVVQSTRTWDPDTGTTRELRTKETEEDYGYIFEPDLTRITIGRDQLAGIRKGLPELPDQKHARFVRSFGMHPKLAETLVSELDLANLFEDVAKRVDPKIASSWIAGYLKKTLNYNDVRFRESGIRKEWITQLLKLFISGGITDRNAELVIRRMVEDKTGPETVIKRHGLGRREAGSDAEDAVKAILSRNPQAVRDYRSGGEKALHFLVGLAMKETGGRIDANDIRKLILRLMKKNEPGRTV
jgi:aspartyl-tRNA(Asn)/glutamyl-tRNA(Gln) amidotransferase subunit B